jgi:hypothetical protein
VFALLECALDGTQVIKGQGAGGAADNHIKLMQSLRQVGQRMTSPLNWVASFRLVPSAVSNSNNFGVRGPGYAQTQSFHTTNSTRVSLRSLKPLAVTARYPTYAVECAPISVELRWQPQQMSVEKLVQRHTQCACQRQHAPRLSFGPRFEAPQHHGIEPLATGRRDGPRLRKRRKCGLSSSADTPPD